MVLLSRKYYLFLQKTKEMKVAVVGATGMVGQVMLAVLAEENFPVTELIPVASEKSVGNKITFGGSTYSVVNLDTALGLKPDKIPAFAESPSHKISRSSPRSRPYLYARYVLRSDRV